MKTVDILCRRIKDKNPKSETFGKLCLCKLLEVDNEGRFHITCPECGQKTVIMLRDSKNKRNEVQANAFAKSGS